MHPRRGPTAQQAHHAVDSSIESRSPESELKSNVIKMMREREMNLVIIIIIIVAVIMIRQVQSNQNLSLLPSYFSV